MPEDGCATIPGVSRWAAILALLLAILAQPIAAQDLLVEARRLYNAGQYDGAERAARTAINNPRLANSARLVLGRTLLERYRVSASQEDFTRAREALRMVNAEELEASERIELMLGLGQGLFLEDRFAAAAEVIEPIIAGAAALGQNAHDRALDWWATALDRYAQTRPPAERTPLYGRIHSRMSAELLHDSGSAPANYWIVAAVRNSGDIEGAWSAAMASWVRSILGRDRGVALRGDLDRLVIQGIIPDRAARIGGKEPNMVVAGLVGEWEAFKASWTR
jgi:tetratricopeptide (TPR) repeat protein